MGEELGAGKKRPHRHALLARLTQVSRPWVRGAGTVAAACVLIAVATAQPSRAEPTKVRLVKNIDPGRDSSLPRSLTDVGETLFFGADDGTHGTELWKSDGTTAGTAMAKDINPGGSSFLPLSGG